jgi:hypothetical protein
MTGWSRNYILHELPLYTGLQLLDYENWSNNIPRVYINDKEQGSIDNLTIIEGAFKTLNQNG